MRLNLYVYTRLLLAGGAFLTIYALLMIAYLAPYIVGLVVIVAIAAKWRKGVRPTTSHGSARLAELDDLRKAKMIGGDGLCVGYVKGGGA